MKQALLISLLSFSCHSMAEWVEYFAGASGNVFYFDNTRVQQEGTLVTVWHRIRYKTSVMGAASYQYLVRIDCVQHTETILQSTYYTDTDWSTPAMATNTQEKPEVSINAGSATASLADILCEE